MNQLKNLKVKDKVRIIKGPLDKLGKVGEVYTIMVNGVMVKLSNNWFTTIKFEHLEKVV